MPLICDVIKFTPFAVDILKMIIEIFDLLVVLVLNSAAIGKKMGSKHWC